MVLVARNDAGLIALQTTDVEEVAAALRAIGEVRRDLRDDSTPSYRAGRRRSKVSNIGWGVCSQVTVDRYGMKLAGCSACEMKREGLLGECFNCLALWTFERDLVEAGRAIEQARMRQLLRGMAERLCAPKERRRRGLRAAEYGGGCENKYHDDGCNDAHLCTCDCKHCGWFDCGEPWTEEAG